MKNVRDGLAASLAKDLNKQTKGSNIAFFLDGSGDSSFLTWDNCSGIIKTYFPK